MPPTAAGINLIKHFEGYHKKQPDGSCVAYYCPAGRPTIGWGCTHGIKIGMRWTMEEAEDGLRKELTHYASEVDRLVTVPLTVQQRDALISFTFNVGATALAKSTLLRKLNARDFEGAEKEFGKWVWGSDGGSAKKVKYKGLIRRRKAEAAMFAENGILPVPVTAPEERMPQEPTTAPAKVPWYSAPLAGVSAAGVWFADKLEGIAAWLQAAGGEFINFAPVTSMFHAAGITFEPFLIGLVVLSGFIAAKTMLKPDEVVE